MTSPGRPGDADGFEYDDRPKATDPPQTVQTVSVAPPPAAAPVTETDTGPGDDRFYGLGGNPDLWKVGDEYYIVHYAPGFEPPIPIVWRVPDEETLKAFGGGSIPKVDKKLTTAQAESAGWVQMGTTDQLPDSEDNPWVGFKDRIDRASRVQPWLTDPDVYAVVAAAYAEGRPVEDWEMEATAWWQARNDREREWARISMADPKTAEQMLATNQIKVSTMFEAIGAAGNDPALLEYMATKYTTGQWDETMLARQVEAVTSGWGELDQGLADWMAGEDIEGISTIDKQEDVRNLFLRWLGPQYAPDDPLVQEWATRIRNDASGDEALTEYLRGQRMALYSEYDNENLTYEDIASPWRSVVSRMWGETADETDPMFDKIVRMNDLAGAEKLLRTEGRKRGNQTVMEDYTRAVSTSTGGSVRRAV